MISLLELRWMAPGNSAWAIKTRGANGVTVLTIGNSYDVSAVYVHSQIRGDGKNITSLPLERMIRFGTET